jgi:hypothetical protein
MTMAGSSQCVGWVERSDTHQLSEDDGFRKWLNPSYGIIVAVAKWDSGFALPRASE